MSNDPVVPEFAEALAQEVKKTPHVEKPTKIFVGLPNMSELNVGLVTKLFAWARNPEILPWYHFVTEKRHTDFARNNLVLEYLKTECEWLAMIDDDVDPHIEFINLYKHNKDIIAANVDCWINNELLPSIWQLSECEQCVVVKKFVETGENHDPSQYKIIGDVLYRWNPEIFSYQQFANRQGVLPGKKCRCLGKGLDPFVFRTWNKRFAPGELVKVDSVGSAAMMINRRVFDKMTMPYFKFYYKESREILLTEDHYFCMVAQTLGFDVWASIDMGCSHYKLIDLLGVKQRVIKAFEAGMKYQESLPKKEEPKIIIPELADIKKPVLVNIDSRLS